MFNPKFTIDPNLVKILLRIESFKTEIDNLPITPTVLASLRETAQIETIHYSTMIEGNRLTEQEVLLAINKQEHFPKKEKDEKEVLGYYAALNELAKLAKEKSITEKQIQLIHALVMGGGKIKVRPSPYRDGQNVIRDSRTRKIVYLPPKAQDVPVLIKDLIIWIDEVKNILPVPIIAAISHYQYATIHPYYDGNGRTVRLLTTLILRKSNYGLKGLYSLEEYYAKDLQGYYQALTIGPSHNYYFGRAEADISPWIEYFCLGMLDSFEKVKLQALKAQKRGLHDKSHLLKNLDPRQRQILNFFQKQNFITSKDIEQFFNVSGRTARNISQKWTNEGFFVIIDYAKKSRKYSLSPKFQEILDSESNS